MLDKIVLTLIAVALLSVIFGFVLGVIYKSPIAQVFAWVTLTCIVATVVLGIFELWHNGG